MNDWRTAETPRASGGTSSDARAEWDEILLQGVAGTSTPTPKAFAERFERSFEYVSHYVGLRVRDRKEYRRIVTAVLTGNLELFLAPGTEDEELGRLRASADRLLAL